MSAYPFKFLDSYTREDKEFFFGRTEEIDALYEMVFQTNILLVYGASGTGKTSIIQCGLANKFKSHEWMDFNIRRGTDLNGSFSRMLADTVTALGMKPAVGADSLESSFRTIYLNYLRPIYLIFDQFEELYILGDRQEQDIFVSTVKDILQLKQPVKVILSIREEYMGYLYDFEKAIPQLLRKKIRIEPMDYGKVRQVILGITGGEDAQISLIPEEKEAFIEELFKKIKGKEKTLTIQLTYLQVFLDKLYMSITQDETRQKKCVFTLQALSEIRSIEDVLSRFLVDQVKKISSSISTKNKPFSEDDMWKILSRMVTLEGTKIPVSRDNVQQRMGKGFDEAFTLQMLTLLVNRRILRYLENQDLYEIAHDSLGLEIARQRTPLQVQTQRSEDLIREKYAAKKALVAEDFEIIGPVMSELNVTDKEKAYALLYWRRLKKARFRKRAFLVTFITVLILLLAFTYREMQAANQARSLAVESRQRAERSLASEKVAVAKATSQQKIAEEQKNRANALADSASAATAQLRTANIEARRRTEEALHSAQLADSSRKEAIRASENADKYSKLAVARADTARLSQQEAEKQKYLTISITLALQSTLSESDTDRTMLALQAYFLNKKYNGGAWIPEIAEALVKSIPSFSTRKCDSVGSAILDIIPCKDMILLVTDAGEIRHYLPDKDTSHVLWKDRNFHYMNNSGYFDPATDELYIGDLGKRRHVFTVGNGALQQKTDRNDPSAGQTLIARAGFTLTASGVQQGTNTTARTALFSFEPGQYGATFAIHAGKEMLAAGTRNGWLYVSGYGKTRFPLFKREFQNSNTRINDISFDKTGQFIATAGNDFRFRLTRYSLLEERPPLEYQFDAWVTSILFLDGRQVLIGTAGGKLYRMNYDQDALADGLCKRLNGRRIHQNKIVTDLPEFINCIK